jgi:uncharacterized protein YigA (DUF484 family)
MTEKRKVATQAMKDKILSLVKEMKLARRSGNIKKEQSAYEKLEKHCEKNKMDFDDAMEWGLKELREHSVNAHGLRY